MKVNWTSENSSRRAEGTTGRKLGNSENLSELISGGNSKKLPIKPLFSGRPTLSGCFNKLDKLAKRSVYFMGGAAVLYGIYYGFKNLVKLFPPNEGKTEWAEQAPLTHEDSIKYAEYLGVHIKSDSVKDDSINEDSLKQVKDNNVLVATTGYRYRVPTYTIPTFNFDDVVFPENKEPSQQEDNVMPNDTIPAKTDSITADNAVKLEADSVVLQQKSLQAVPQDSLVATQDSLVLVQDSIQAVPDSIKTVNNPIDSLNVVNKTDIPKIAQSEESENAVEEEQEQTKYVTVLPKEGYWTVAERYLNENEEDKNEIKEALEQKLGYEPTQVQIIYAATKMFAKANDNDLDKEPAKVLMVGQELVVPDFKAPLE